VHFYVRFVPLENKGSGRFEDSESLVESLLDFFPPFSSKLPIFLSEPCLISYLLQMRRIKDNEIIGIIAKWKTGKVGHNVRFYRKFTTITTISDKLSIIYESD